MLQGRLLGDPGHQRLFRCHRECEARTWASGEPSDRGDELVLDLEFGVDVVVRHVVLLHLVGTAVSMAGPLAMCAHFWIRRRP